ncbi:MAG TPA: hypothetical protein VHE60_04055 [Pyrinomonadaceae bacterium]|nr:hypothetical protein [Pyrinomonadaceae bacterium]
MSTHVSPRIAEFPSFPLLDLIDAYEAPPEEDAEALIGLLATHPLRILRPFLRGYGIPLYENKALIIQSIRNAVASGGVPAADLISILDQIEGWGNQHSYLYRSTVEAGDAWSSENGCREILRKNGLAHLCNRRNPALIPDRLHLSSVCCSGDRVVFQWTDKRVTKFRLPDQDHEDGDVMFLVFRRIVTRGVITFDWDLTTGHAALMIQRLPTGTDYGAVKSRIEHELEPLIGIRGFKQLRLAGAVDEIEQSGEARRRQYKHETERGSVASFTSASRTRDAFDDPALEDARKALGPATVALLGNFYWTPAAGRLEREIHVKLYPKDKRVGIFGACSEAEVRYLLSRIRHHSL